jgi:hypothetical protein
MPQYRFNGTIKAITFKDARVSVLLENTTFFSNEGDWKQWVDWKLIETGKYKKGDVWVSAFEQSAPEVFQACKVIEKGSEVEVDIFKTEKGFLNINNIRMGVPDKDINEDLKPPDEPSSEQRPPDSPEAEAEKLTEKEPQPPWPPGATKEKSSNAVDKDTLIIRQTCVKAVGSGMRLENENDAEVAVVIAKRLEKFVLEGK